MFEHYNLNVVFNKVFDILFIFDALADFMINTTYFLFHFCANYDNLFICLKLLRSKEYSWCLHLFGFILKGVEGYLYCTLFRWGRGEGFVGKPLIVSIIPCKTQTCK